MPVAESEAPEVPPTPLVSAPVIGDGPVRVVGDFDLYSDPTDDRRRWYLPRAVVVDDVEAFEFRCTSTGAITADGDTAREATVRMRLRRDAGPLIDGVDLSAVPWRALHVVLELRYKRDGVDVQRELVAQVLSPLTADAIDLAFAIPVDLVAVAFAALTQGDATPAAEVAPARLVVTVRFIGQVETAPARRVVIRRRPRRVPRRRPPRPPRPRPRRRPGGGLDDIDIIDLEPEPEVEEQPPDDGPLVRTIEVPAVYGPRAGAATFTLPVRFDCRAHRYLLETSSGDVATGCHRPSTVEPGAIGNQPLADGELGDLTDTLRGYLPLTPGSVTVVPRLYKVAGYECITRSIDPQAADSCTAIANFTLVPDVPADWRDRLARVLAPRVRDLRTVVWPSRIAAAGVGATLPFAATAQAVFTGDALHLTVAPIALSHLAVFADLLQHGGIRMSLALQLDDGQVVPSAIALGPTDASGAPLVPLERLVEATTLFWRVQIHASCDFEALAIDSIEVAVDLIFGDVHYRSSATEPAVLSAADPSDLYEIPVRLRHAMRPTRASWSATVIGVDGAQRSLGPFTSDGGLVAIALTHALVRG